MLFEHKQCLQDLDVKFYLFFVIKQYYCELPKGTIRANGNVYHNFRDVQNLYRDEASMDMTPNELKLLTSTRWN